MEIKNKGSYIYFWSLLVFLIHFNNGFADKKNYILVKNLHDLDHNYLSFNAFYKVYLKEVYLNDNSTCNNCSMIGKTHNRYDLLNITADEKCFGKFDSCVVEQPSKFNTFVLKPKNDPSYSYIASFTNNCGTCICHCYPSILHRHRNNFIDSICLDPLFVDVTQKQVIIGVRFVRVKNVIMIQLKQGQAQDEFSIARGSNSWLPSSTECTNVVQLNHNNSYFLLDDAMLQENQVVTGIAIKKCDYSWTFLNTSIRSRSNCEGNFFYLTVFGTSIANALSGTDDDIVEGTLKGPKSLKERVDLTNDDMLPSEFAPTNTIQQSGNFFIKFRSTSWSEDKGKHVVPYLNSQPTEAKPSKLLRGVGLLYSGAEGYGGFISPVLHAYSRY